MFAKLHRSGEKLKLFSPLSPSGTITVCVGGAIDIRDIDMKSWRVYVVSNMYGGA